MALQSIQGHADLDLAYALSYFLAGDVQLPESLRQLVWPDLDRWQAELPDAPGRSWSFWIDFVTCSHHLLFPLLYSISLLRSYLQGLRANFYIFLSRGYGTAAA